MNAKEAQRDSILDETETAQLGTIDQAATVRAVTDQAATAPTTANQAVTAPTAANQMTADQAATNQVKATLAAPKLLSEMDLLDDFLLNQVVTYPEIGEVFVGFLLKTILGREVKHLSVTAQKVFYGADTNLHGARFDVYLESEIEEGVEGNATVYDIEPESGNKSSDRKALPWRTRFYHGKITARSLRAGADYKALKNVVVIMIMPFDPFGLDRMEYTIKNKCVEVPEMEYEDGASTIFLYTKGTQGIPSEAVRQMLHYMEDTTYENAVNEDLRKIHGMVETVKKDQKVARVRMKMVEDIIRQNEKITELEDRNTELEDRNTKLEDRNTKLEDRNTKLEDRNTKLEDRNTKLEDENAKQAEEIRKLREELDRRNGK